MIYTYQVSTSIDSARVNLDRLTKEIEESSLTPSLERIDSSEDNLVLVFFSSVTADEEIKLAAIIRNHSGEPLEDIEEVTKVEISSPVENNAFASKGNYHFRGSGKKFTCLANATTSCEYVVEYGHVKFNGISILNGNNGDTCNLKVLDNSTGLFSSIPDYTLDQFGYDWNVMASGTKEMLPYVADLYQTMRIVIEYTNNTDSNLELMVNYYIHEE